MLGESFEKRSVFPVFQIKVQKSFVGLNKIIELLFKGIITDNSYEHDIDNDSRCSMILKRMKGLINNYFITIVFLLRLLPVLGEIRSDKMSRDFRK